MQRFVRKHGLMLKLPGLIAENSLQRWHLKSLERYMWAGSTVTVLIQQWFVTVTIVLNKCNVSTGQTRTNTYYWPSVGAYKRQSSKVSRSKNWLRMCFTLHQSPAKITHSNIFLLYSFLSKFKYTEYKKHMQGNAFWSPSQMIQLALG